MPGGARRDGDDDAKVAAPVPHSNQLGTNDTDQGVNTILRFNPTWHDLAAQTGVSDEVAYAFWKQAAAGAGGDPGKTLAGATLLMQNAGLLGGGGPGEGGAASTSGSAPSTSGGGGSSGGGSGVSAQDKARALANLQAGFLSIIRTWGINVTPKLRKLVESAAAGGWNSQAFTAALRDTDEYSKQFPGIQWRRGMSEATYNAQFDQFVERAQDAGYKLGREGFSQLLKKGVDSAEWSLRVQVVKQVKANKPLLESFEEYARQMGALKPNEEMSAKDVKRLAVGAGTSKFTTLWNAASVDAGLEGIGFEVGRGGDISRKELLQMLKVPVSQLGPSETLQVDFAQLAKTASMALPASRLYKMGITKKDLVSMALGGKNAAKIASRVELAINTARATAEETRANPQLTQGGMQLGREPTQATE